MVLGLLAFAHFQRFSFHYDYTTSDRSYLAFLCENIRKIRSVLGIFLDIEEFQGLAACFMQSLAGVGRRMKMKMELGDEATAAFPVCRGRRKMET